MCAEQLQCTKNHTRLCSIASDDNATKRPAEKVAYTNPLLWGRRQRRISVNYCQRQGLQLLQFACCVCRSTRANGCLGRVAVDVSTMKRVPRLFLSSLRMALKLGLQCRHRPGPTLYRQSS